MTETIKQVNVLLPAHYRMLIKEAKQKKIREMHVKCEGELKENEKILETYWVIPYFSQACIAFNTETGRKRYLLLEPLLSREEAEFVNAIYIDMRRILAYSERSGDRVKTIFETFEDLLDEYAVEISEDTKFKILYYLLRNFLGFGIIDGLMNDPELEDISCDGYSIPNRNKE